MQIPFFQTVTSKFTISPVSRGLSSGIPWQITSLTEVQRDLGNLWQLYGAGYPPFEMMNSWIFLSISSVVTPAFTRVCPQSRACLDSNPTSRSISSVFPSETWISFWYLDSISFFGYPVKQQSGFQMCSGIGSLGEIFPGRRGPENLNPDSFFFLVYSGETWISLWIPQAVLKQSCPQKQVASNSIFRQVGHCKAAGLGHPGIAHFDAITQQQLQTQQ